MTYNHAQEMLEIKHKREVFGLQISYLSNTQVRVSFKFNTDMTNFWQFDILDL